MKREDKELLFKDICARLPYNVIVHIHDFNTIDYDNYLYAETLAKFESNDVTLKPYFRLMSDMTEEERETYSLFSYAKCNDKAFDWLNAHHFDYRGLIGKGLAIAVTKENNPYK